MTLHPPEESLWIPYRDGADELAYPATFPGTNARVYHVLWLDGGLLTDFVLLQQVDTGGREEPEWTDILRVDCCHQEVHIHRLYADPDDVYKVIRPIRTPEDLRLGAEYAEAVVCDEFDEHMRRWEHGR